MKNKNNIGKHLELKDLSVAKDLTEKLILDGTKIHWYQERLAAWKNGEGSSPNHLNFI